MIPYIDSRPDGYDGLESIDSSPGYFAKDIMASGIAVYNIGGWFDGFTRGTVQLFATMRSKNPSRLLIGPKFHLPGVPDDYAALFKYKGNLKEQTAIERLRFFDRYLKGIRNGIENDPPVNIYVMNSGWRAENEWPLKRQKVTKFFLNGKRRIVNQKGHGRCRQLQRRFHAQLQLRRYRYQPLYHDVYPGGGDGKDRPG